MKLFRRIYEEVTLTLEWNDEATGVKILQGAGYQITNSRHTDEYVQITGRKTIKEIKKNLKGEANVNESI